MIRTIYDVACPYCGAPRLVACRTSPLDRERAKPHVARREAFTVSTGKREETHASSTL